MDPYVTHMDLVCSKYLHFHYCKYYSTILLIFFLKKTLFSAKSHF